MDTVDRICGCLGKWMFVLSYVLTERPHWTAFIINFNIFSRFYYRWIKKAVKVNACVCIPLLNSIGKALTYALCDIRCAGWYRVKTHFLLFLRQKYLWDPSNFDPHAYGISLQRQHLVPYKGHTHKVSVHNPDLTKDVSKGFSNFIVF